MDKLIAKLVYYEKRLDTPCDSAVTVDELRTLVEHGEVSPDARVWHDGMDEWRSLHLVPELWSEVRQGIKVVADGLVREVRKSACASEQEDSDDDSDAVEPELIYYELAPDTPCDTAVTKDELRALVASSQVVGSTQVWQDGMDDWQELETVAKLWRDVRHHSASTGAFKIVCTLAFLRPPDHVVRVTAGRLSCGQVCVARAGFV